MNKNSLLFSLKKEVHYQLMLIANQTSDCINTGDTTWVLISSILVLSMMPALAFFEGI